MFSMRHQFCTLLMVALTSISLLVCIFVLCSSLLCKSVTYSGEKICWYQFAVHGYTQILKLFIIAKVQFRVLFFSLLTTVSLNYDGLRVTSYVFVECLTLIWFLPKLIAAMSFLLDDFFGANNMEYLV